MCLVRSESDGPVGSFQPMERCHRYGYKQPVGNTGKRQKSNQNMSFGFQRSKYIFCVIQVVNFAYAEVKSHRNMTDPMSPVQFLRVCAAISGSVYIASVVTSPRHRLTASKHR